MHDVRDRQAALGMDARHAAERSAAHRGAVIGVPAADDDRLFRLALHVPVAADEADVGVVRLGPRAGIEDVVQIAGRQFRDLRGERDRGHMRGLEEGVVIAQLLHLPRGDLGQFLAAIADVDAPEARHAVDDLLALAVGQPDALAARDDARALPGQRGILGEGMHVMRGVQRLEFLRGHVIGDLGHGETCAKPVVTVGPQARCVGKNPGPAWRAPTGTGPEDPCSEYDQKSWCQQNLIKFRRIPATA